MFTDEFNEDFLIGFNPFCVQDGVKSLEELCLYFRFLLTLDAKLDHSTTGVEGFDNFIFIIAGEDESTVS